MESDTDIVTPSPEEFDAWLDVLVDIYYQAYRGLFRYAYRHRSDIRRYIKWLHRVDPKGFLVAVRSHEPVGFMATCRHWWDRAHGEVGEMHELVVHPNFRGQGIGRLLFQAGMDYLEGEHRTMALWVGKNNARAIAFYQKWGFEEAGKVGEWLRMLKVVD